MKLKIFGLVLLISFLACSTSKMISNKFGEIKGYVSDSSTNEGLPSAKVYMIGYDTTETNLDGSFQFTNIDPGIFDLKASYPLYHDNANNITVKAAQTFIVNFKIEQDSISIKKDRDKVDKGEIITIE